MTDDDQNEDLKSLDWSAVLEEMVNVYLQQAETLFFLRAVSSRKRNHDDDLKDFQRCLDRLQACQERLEEIYNK